MIHTYYVRYNRLLCTELVSCRLHLCVVVGLWTLHVLLMSSVNNRSFILFSDLIAFRFFSLPYWMKIPSTI